jgi:hypothetical protein
MAVTTRWQAALNGDPLPWLLEDADPAVRHLALQRLAGRPADDPEVERARALAMKTHPIASFLGAQDPAGWWSMPGSGYGPKYQGTVWTLIFLGQLGADGRDPRVRAGCEYMLEHSQAGNGGIGARGGKSVVSPPPPSSVIHCLNGNMLRALIGFGMLDDERVQRAIDWQVATVTGSGEVRYYASTTAGPDFRCGANDGLPCAWGAVKVLMALAAIPGERRSQPIQDALDATVELLLSCDPATAGYPMGYGNTKPNGSWFKLGFPSGYVSDVLQVAEGLCEVGLGRDPRLANLIDLVLESQGDDGRWSNRYAYQGKMAADIDVPGQPSKWVTLRACTVLRGALGDGVGSVDS